MKKMFFITATVMFILGMFIAETAHAQPPIKTQAPIKKAKVSEMDQKVLNTFVPVEETEAYLNTRVCVKQFEVKAYQWVRIINGALTAIRLETGFDQNVISVWKKDTDPDALGQLPDYQIPAAKKVWDVQTLETEFAFIIFYKTLNDNGDVEIIEVDIP